MDTKNITNISFLSVLFPRERGWKLKCILICNSLTRCPDFIQSEFLEKIFRNCSVNISSSLLIMFDL